MEMEVHRCLLRPSLLGTKLANLDLKRLLVESSIAGAGNAWEELEVPL